MKARIPLGKKPKGDDDESEEIEEERADSSQEDRTDATDISDMQEDEDDEPQSKSLVYKLKKKIQSLQKKNVKLASKASSDDEEEEGGEKDSEAEKKKKKSKMLQIVIGGGLVLFLLSDYLIPTEEPTATPVLKPRKKGPKKPDTAATEEPKKDETPATETKEATTTTATTETTPDSPVTVTSEDVPTDVPLETTPAETTPTEITPTETATTDTTVTEPSTDTTVDTAIETAPTETATTDTTMTEPSTDVPTSVDSVDGGETKTAGDDSITDQILQDLEKQAKGSKPIEQKKEYVSPPDYEYRGRGLVYNCSGKHWACVDAPSYKTCEDNASSVKFLNKRTECYPFNVYETPKGCENMQNRMVSSSAKTAFCSE